MLLHIVYDLVNKTYSHPMVSPDLSTVQNALNELNPANLLDLKIIELQTLDNLDQLLSLRVDPKINPQDILSNLQ